MTKCDMLMPIASLPVMIGSLDGRFGGFGAGPDDIWRFHVGVRQSERPALLLRCWHETFVGKQAGAVFSRFFAEAWRQFDKPVRLVLLYCFKCTNGGLHL